MIDIIGTELYQWDTGRSVSVENTEASHVHFANQGDSQAVIMELSDLTAKIPDYLLQTGKQLCVYAVANGITVEKKMFSVKKRERPENYIYDEDRRNYIYKLITDAQAATEAANNAAQDILDAKERGEFNGLIDDSRVSEFAWSSKNIIDKLFPLFTKSGAVVTCEPFEGYPLTVIVEEGATAIIRCRKNLWNFKGDVVEIAYTSQSGTVSTRFGFELALPAGTYTLHAERASDDTADRYLYGVINNAEGGFVKVIHLVAAQAFSSHTITLEDGDVLYVYNGNSSTETATQNLFTELLNVQIEAGSTATSYEAYEGETFAPGAAIPALQGVNKLFADTGNITVTGRKGGFSVPWITTVSLLSSKWEGADNLHSQVVDIAGLTPYSKVDLLPSVEQLAIFYNKDVTFVTENEDGVVTVYAIGEKPTLDYTMQVQITEVAV